MGRNLLLHMLIEHLAIIKARIAVEGVLHKERHIAMLHAIAASEVDSSPLLAQGFSFHKFPTIVGIGSHSEFAQIGLHATAHIPCTHEMGVIVASVEKAIKSAIGRKHEFVGQNAILRGVSYIKSITCLKIKSKTLV